jgi:hypothetical protein
MWTVYAMMHELYAQLWNQPQHLAFVKEPSCASTAPVISFAGLCPSSSERFVYLTKTYERWKLSLWVKVALEESKHSSTFSPITRALSAEVCHIYTTIYRHCCMDTCLRAVRAAAGEQQL